MSRPTKAEINFSSLNFNLKKLRNISPKSEFFPVVKANAYGHGAREVVKYLENKVEGFCVATTEEAINLRKVSNLKILDMEGPYDMSDINEAHYKKIDFVIHSARQLNLLSKLKKISNNLSVWIKFDSGMNRLGFDKDEVIKAIIEIQKKTKNIVLMSHFSSYRGNPKQLKLFNTLEKSLVENGIVAKRSLCNSGGMINYPSSQKDIARPGLCLFGSKSNLIDKNINLKPVMNLKSKFISIKNIKKDQIVGYEGTWKAKRNSVIGILPIGYADGYPINLSNKGYVKIQKKLAPVVGKVSMDMLAIDITSFNKISYKDEVILWGDGHEVDTVAKYADNSPYSLLSGLTERVNRTYI